MKLLEQVQVSPPPGSVANSSLLLTYLDVLWLEVPPVQRLFLYQLNHPKADILHSIIPKLKHSLSLTLQLFYPLAGILTFSEQTGDHIICYTDGDSVPLTVAESDDDFQQLLSNHAQDVTNFHLLVPPLDTSDTQKKPLLALQVTIFPNSGICIGRTMHHVAADGSSLNHFMKSWSSICKSGGDLSVVTPLPIFDRSIASNLEQIKRKYFLEMEKVKVSESLKELEVKKTLDSDVVRSTFILTRADIERLRRRVLTRTEVNQKAAHCSSFVLTCAHVWISLVKAKGISGEKKVNFAFAMDCRPRLKPRLPNEYFGNCIGGCFADAKVCDLDGEDGLIMGSKCIRRAIQEMDGDVLKDAELWTPKFLELSNQLVLSVAGSPRFRVYDTDFGWGRPKKVEVISIEKTGAISLAESRDEEGGVEIGLSLTKYEMDKFAALFEEGLGEVS